VTVTAAALSVLVRRIRGGLVVDEGDAVTAQAVDQFRGAGGLRDLRICLVPAGRGTVVAGLQDGEDGEADRIWSSRTYRFFGRPGSGRVALL
jgi:hypothetical protein